MFFPMSCSTKQFSLLRLTHHINDSKKCRQEKKTPSLVSGQIFGYEDILMTSIKMKDCHFITTVDCQQKTILRVNSQNSGLQKCLKQSPKSTYETGLRVKQYPDYCYERKLKNDAEMQLQQGWGPRHHRKPFLSFAEFIIAVTQQNQI